MQSCEQPSFLLDSDTVWIERDQAGTAANGTKSSYTIREFADEFALTLRTLRFYESRGLISPLRNARTRLYGVADRDRIALILKARRFGFTLAEIGEMIGPQRGGASTSALKISRKKCLDQIDLLERQREAAEEALAELRRIHATLTSPAAQRVG
jgi:DNA-binding transcriptional MerR regulator